MAKKKTTKKTAAVKVTAKKQKKKGYRVIIYNSIGQVQRNKFFSGTEDEVNVVAGQLKKTVSKGSKIEITPV